MLIQSLLLSTARWAGSLLFGGIILWQIAEHSGSTKGRVIVHVSKPGVEVEVDEVQYRVETMWEAPIVCDLTPGRHIARMICEGRVVFREEFNIGRGEEIILSAWDGYEDGRSPKETR